MTHSSSAAARATLFPISYSSTASALALAPAGQKPHSRHPAIDLDLYRTDDSPLLCYSDSYHVFPAPWPASGAAAPATVGVPDDANIRAKHATTIPHHRRDARRQQEDTCGNRRQRLQPRTSCCEGPCCCYFWFVPVKCHFKNIRPHFRPLIMHEEMVKQKS